MRASPSCAPITCSTPISATSPPAGKKAWLKRTCRTVGGASGSRLKPCASLPSSNSMHGWPSAAAHCDELRHPEHPALSVADVLEQEQSQMMPMPTPFDGYVEKVARVSSTCLVTVSRNRYSVPCELAGQMVSARLYPGRVCVVAGDAVVASHERVAERGQVRYDWQHYIPLVQRKPGALRNGAPFADMPAPLIRLKQGLLRRAGGDKVMAQVLAAVPTAGLPALLVAVELVVESGVLSAEHVENVLARLNGIPAPASVETSLQLQEAPVANTGRYDSLRATGADLVEADHA